MLFHELALLRGCSPPFVFILYTRVSYYISLESAQIENYLKFSTDFIPRRNSANCEKSGPVLYKPEYATLGGKMQHHSSLIFHFGATDLGVGPLHRRRP